MHLVFKAMKKGYSVIQLVVFILLLGTKVFGQQTDKTVQVDTVQQDSSAQKKNLFEQFVDYFKEAKEDKSAEKFDISFIGGPSYSVDTKLGIGVVASGLYRLDKEHLALPPSNISIYSNITTSGFFSIGIGNNTIFSEDSYRVNADFNFAYMPTRYYGIGFEAGDQGVFSKFDKRQVYFKADLLKKVSKNLYAGLAVSVKDLKSSNFKNKRFKPKDNLHNTVLGSGFILSYDSRDFIPNPSEGWYIKYEQRFFPKAFGNNNTFNQIDFTLRTYQKIGPKTIVAFDFNGILKNGDVPWNMLSQVGGSRQMRGYYSGRYRDKKQFNSQIEIRQKIYNRHGVAVWGGLGKIFDSFSNLDFHHILPTYGIGYRWEFKDRVNIRLDYGIGKDHGGFYFNINEAF